MKCSLVLEGREVAGIEWSERPFVGLRCGPSCLAGVNCQFFHPSSATQQNPQPRWFFSLL